MRRGEGWIREDTDGMKQDRDAQKTDREVLNQLQTCSDSQFIIVGDDENAVVDPVIPFIAGEELVDIVVEDVAELDGPERPVTPTAAGAPFLTCAFRNLGVVDVDVFAEVGVPVPIVTEGGKYSFGFSILLGPMILSNVIYLS